MTTLSQDKKNLLNKLFNLKGDDNIIIKKNCENIDETTDLIKDITNQKIDNEAKKIDSEGKLSLFESQKDTFNSIFNGLDNDTFAALRGININIEIGTMLVTIEEQSPIYIKQLNDEIADYEEKIKKNNQKIEELTESLNSLRSEKSQNEDNRSKLNSLLEQSLSPDETERESLTTSHVKKILSLFDIFSTSEINSLTKIIIFPDEGLYEYVDYLDGKEPVLEDDSPAEAEELESKIDSENIIEEPSEKEISLFETSTQELKNNDEDIKIEETPASDLGAELIKESQRSDDYIPVIEEKTEDKTIDLYKDIVNKEDINDSIDLIDDLEKTSLLDLNLDKPEQIILDEKEEIVEEPENSSEKISSTEMNDIEGFLEEQGLSLEMFSDINNITSSDIIEMISKTDLNIIKENYEILRTLNVSEQATYRFINNYSYLTDQDFNKKITLLRIKNVSEHKIKDLLEDNNDGLREDIQTFENRIKALEDIKPITDENISDIADDILKFKENYNEFIKNGFELEEKEVRNYEKVILESAYIHEDLTILKNYLISIIRKNGKYALSVFWKEPYELLTDIDDLIESDLEELITTHPEILAEKNTEVLKRVKYCEDNVIPILENNDDTSFCDYIYNYLKFAEKFAVKDLPSLFERETTNKILKDKLNKDLVNILDNYYDQTIAFDEITLDEHTKNIFNDLKNQILNKLNAQSPSKYAYKLGNICISKNKFERNLSVILNALSNISSDVDDTAIILVAALYNIRKDEQSINDLITDILSGIYPVGGNA